MEKYEIYKNKDIDILRNIINDDSSTETDRIIASIIIAENEIGYEMEDTFNEILSYDRDKKIC